VASAWPVNRLLVAVPAAAVEEKKPSKVKDPLRKPATDTGIRKKRLPVGRARVQHGKTAKTRLQALLSCVGKTPWWRLFVRGFQAHN